MEQSEIIDLEISLEQLEKIVDYIKKHLNDRWDTDKRDPVWS